MQHGKTLAGEIFVLGFLYWDKYFCSGINIFVLPLWATVFLRLNKFYKVAWSNPSKTVRKHRKDFIIHKL